MKQKCDSIRELLGAFADGELEPDKAEQVVNHLETCADCRRELDQIRELSRLAKSVGHPQLADDYWDWHRSRVWRGIRQRKHGSEPRHRPMFVWPKLAAAAAGFVIVLVVVLAGWRTLLTEPGRERNLGPTGETPVGTQTAARPEATTSSGARQVARKAAGPAGGASQTEVEGSPDGFALAPAAAEADREEAEVGHAAKGTGASDAAKPVVVPPRPVGSSTKDATAEQGNELASTPQAEQRLRATSRKKSRIVSGPVLIESPTLADADVTDTGTVLLRVKTDSTGRVVGAAVSRSSGSARLDSMAVRQMRQSRFKAAVKNNRSVPASFEYPFRVQKRQTQTRTQEQQRPQQKQKLREESQSQQTPSQQSQQKQSAGDEKSERPDSGNKDLPLKEKTSK
jgi:TonB family protein